MVPDSKGHGFDEDDASNDPLSQPVTSEAPGVHPGAAEGPTAFLCEGCFATESQPSFDGGLDPGVFG